MRLSGTPSADGFYMPAEFSPHRGTVIIFPERPGSWGYGAEPAQYVFADIIREIAKDETTFVIVSDGTEAKARAMLAGIDNVNILSIPSDDSWARDVAPTFVSDGSAVRGIDWQFNAWGGEYDGLYAHWERDNALASRFCHETGYDFYDAQHFVLEGGSIHSDGEGTVMVTESCLLSKGRNPSLTKEEIEQTLCKYLGAEKVLWLPRGIYNDETNEHVDNVCAFIRPGEVVLAWTDNENDPQFPLSKASLDYLEGETETVAKNLTEVKKGDAINFLCDYYSYEGEYQDSYYLGDTMVLGDEVEIGNIRIDAAHTEVTYRLTDIYQQTYWTPVVPE